MNKKSNITKNILVNAIIMVLLCVNISIPALSLEDNVIENESELLIALTNPGINTIILSADIQLTTALKVERSVDFVSDGEIKRTLYSPVDNITAQNKRHMLVYGDDISLSFENVELIGSDIGKIGGGIQSFSNTLTLNNAIIKNCNADNGSGVQSSGTVIVNGGTISQNKTSGGGAIYGKFITVNDGALISGNTSKQGGGICVGDDCSVIINGGTITGNTASLGGGIYGGFRTQINVFGGEISDNSLGQSDAFGGGITVKADSVVTVTEGKIIGNKAQYGGGMANYGNGKATFNISGGLIANNTASNQGGAIYCNSASELNISEDVKIIANKAGSGGAIFANANSTVNISGGEISANEASGSGGAIYAYIVGVTPGCFVDINISGDAKMIGNKALNGGAVRAIAEHEGSDVITLNMSGEAEISGNTASNNGGGICDYAGYPGSFVINISENAKINDNTAINGGGIYAGQKFTAVNLSNNAQITNNKASNDGGGIWTVSYPQLTADGVYFSGNTARADYRWDLDDNGLDGEPVADSATHKSNIKNTTYSNDFTNAYNNYDVNYEIFTIKFMDGDELIETRNIYKNSIVGESFDLTKTNFIFEGWYDGETEWDFENNFIENNLTLYAKWLPVSLPEPPPPTTKQNYFIQEYIPTPSIPNETVSTEPETETESETTQATTEKHDEYINSSEPVVQEPEETTINTEPTAETETYIEINENDIPLGETVIIEEVHENTEDIVSFEPDEIPLYVETTENNENYVELNEIVPINETDPVEVIENGDVPPLSSGVVDIPQTADNNIIITIIIFLSAAILGYIYKVNKRKFNQ